MHFGDFREELPFEVWFTRILINGCLDRIKARRRRGTVDSHQRTPAAPSVTRPTCPRTPGPGGTGALDANAAAVLAAALASFPSGSGWCSC